MFAVNTYVVWDDASREAAIVDPGMVSEADNNKLSEFIRRNNLRIKYLINTHLHIDHTLGNDYIEAKYSAGTYAHPADSFLGQQRAGQARMFGLGMAPKPLDITHELKDKEKLWLGKEVLEVLAVPGHSPGSIALYSPDGGFVITGDALFNRGIGRTDLPGGNHKTLIESITKRLFTLPSETMVYPGHGPETSIGDERIALPFTHK